MTSMNESIFMLFIVSIVWTNIIYDDACYSFFERCFLNYETKMFRNIRYDKLSN